LRVEPGQFRWLQYIPDLTRVSGKGIARVPTEVTVGIDIGTTSVKAVAADAEGRPVATARAQGSLRSRRAGELGHDADRVWRAAVLEALDQVVSGPEDLDVRGVNVAAMVPSLCAVDGDGRPISDGILYGDERGRGAAGDAGANPSESGELSRFLSWLVREYPDAAGYWPAQAVANHALMGLGVIDTVVAMTTLPLFDFTGWDTAAAAEAGLDDTSKLPALASGSGPIGKVSDGQPAAGAVVGPGTIDAFGEQLVSGADDDGDVLVILGSTAIVWAVTPEWVDRDAVWTVPHTTPGKTLVGGPSNAGGLFLDWVRRALGEANADELPAANLDAVPVWQPYLRGERVPLHDPNRRASLHDLHIGMGPAEIWRGAVEASGFAIRHILDLAGVPTSRLVVTGGGAHSRSWTQALADVTGLPVDVVAVPQGAALGTAYLGRVAAGLEPDASGAGRWARTGHRVEPDDRATEAAQPRYERYRQLSEEDR
jgi:xylulokinase